MLLLPKPKFLRIIRLAKNCVLSLLTKCTKKIIGVEIELAKGLNYPYLQNILGFLSP